MKKFTIVCCVLLVAAALVTGSIAYFTDSVESNQNVIAAGTLDIEQHEFERKKAEGKFVQDETTGEYALQVYTQHQTVYPSGLTNEDIALAANRQACKVDYVPANETASVYKAISSLYCGITPGYIDKIVAVENVGTLNCCLRTFVAVPACYDGDARCEWLHLDFNAEGAADDAGQIAPYWQVEGPYRGEIKGVAHDIYVLTYQQHLAPGAYAPPSLLGFTMDQNVGNDGQLLVYKKNGQKLPIVSTQTGFEIQVKSEASQAIVFDSVQQALNTTFKPVTETVDGVTRLIYHPWMEQQNP